MGKTTQSNRFDFRDFLYSSLFTARLSHTVDEDGDGLPLVDRLTPDCDGDIGRGKEEIMYLVDKIVDDLDMSTNHMLKSFDNIPKCATCAGYRKKLMCGKDCDWCSTHPKVLRDPSAQFCEDHTYWKQTRA